MAKKIIYFNGMPGSGKLTIANMVAEQTNAKVIDNHKINNLLFDIKQFDEEVPDFVWDSFKVIKDELYSLLERLPQENDYIFTGVATNFKANRSFAGVKNLADKLNADFYSINFVCNRENLLDRIDTPARKAKKKLTCKKLYDEIVDETTLKVMEVGKHIVIDNSNLTEQETLEKVMEFLKK